MGSDPLLERVIVALLGALVGIVGAAAYVLRRASARGHGDSDGPHARVVAAIRNDRQTVEWQQAIRREVRHEIANAVMITVEHLRRIDPPGALDVYRDQALAAIADAFETWRTRP